jgi:anti-sigma-K factor RskA
VALVEGLPIYAAQLRVPASSMGWLLSVSPDHQNLIAVAADDFLQLGRHRLHLWCLTPDAPPILIGELPVARDGSAQFAVPAAIRGRRDVSFAISLEPAQGPQNGAPAGPILNQSRALDVI